MKILLVLCEMQDLGGIINHAEHLTWGLKQNGHTVDFVRLENKKACQASSSTRPTEKSNYTGMQLDQRAGWIFDVSQRVPFLAGNWKQFTSTYDLVIWETPVPIIKFEENWREPYDINTPQILFSHDANMVKLYPHLAEVADKFRVFACVHPASLGNALALGVKTARLVLNPQAELTRRIQPPGDKRRQVCSFQTFKACKRVDATVTAAPLFEPILHLYGGGIEYYYMSGIKRKPKYGRIWETALESGKMQFHGYVNEQIRDIVMKQSLLTIDASWSKGHNKYGALFNRVTVESIIQGTPPLLCYESVFNQNIFAEGSHYSTIGLHDSPQVFADKVNRGARASYDMLGAQQIVRDKFDAIKIAKELLE